MAKADEPAGGDEARKLVTGTALARILKASDDASRQTSEINGGVRDKIKKLYENDLVRSPAAIALVRRLNRMDDDDLKLFFEDFDHMADVGGLRERAENATGDMFAAGEDETDEETQEREGTKKRNKAGSKKRKSNGAAAKPEVIEGRADGRTRQPAEVPG